MINILHYKQSSDSNGSMLVHLQNIKSSFWHLPINIPLIYFRFIENVNEVIHIASVLMIFTGKEFLGVGKNVTINRTIFLFSEKYLT